MPRAVQPVSLPVIEQVAAGRDTAGQEATGPSYRAAMIPAEFAHAHICFPPGGPSSLFCVFSAAADRHPDRPCLGWRAGQSYGFWSYQETRARVEQVCKMAASCGVAVLPGRALTGSCAIGRWRPVWQPSVLQESAWACLVPTARSEWSLPRWGHSRMSSARVHPGGRLTVATRAGLQQAALRSSAAVRHAAG